MRCPAKLPSHLQVAVEAAFAEAEQHLFSRKLGRLSSGDVEELSSRFVLSVLPAFVTGACEAVIQSEWTLERLREEVIEFMRCLIAEVDYELEPHRGGTSQMIAHDRQWKLLRRLQRRDEWRKVYLDPVVELTKSEFRKSSLAPDDPDGRVALFGVYESSHASTSKTNNIDDVAKGANTTSRTLRAWLAYDTQAGPKADRAIRDFLEKQIKENPKG